MKALTISLVAGAALCGVMSTPASAMPISNLAAAASDLALGQSVRYVYNGYRSYYGYGGVLLSLDGRHRAELVAAASSSGSDGCAPADGRFQNRPHSKKGCTKALQEKDGKHEHESPSPQASTRRNASEY